MTPPDHLSCAACGASERAAEGAPCEGGAAFVCALCTLRGVGLCAVCTTGSAAAGAT
jgi:hypothetical protein